MTEPVDWALATRVARRVAGRSGGLAAADRASLAAQFDDYVGRAEDLVATETGLRSLSGSGRARVVDRVEWAEANVASFRRLLAPILTKLGDQLAATKGPMSLARTLSGAEVGMLLGWMSSRVLGQYDLLVVDDVEPESQDLVYIVGPNVLGLERRFGFDPDQFRLWLALHEVTHRAQFTGVTWMREHFLSLVHSTIDSFDPDPRRLLDGLRRAASAERTQAMADGGVLALFATPEQRVNMNRIGGLMSLLEGHGDIVMNRATHIPEAARFARILGERRRNQSGTTRLVQRIIGLEAKLAQYEQGERFIEAIEAAAGRSIIDQCFAHPDHLPSLEEIRNPHEWLARMGLLAA